MPWEKLKSIAESGFDPPTPGLWAQYASTAPPRLPLQILNANHLIKPSTILDTQNYQLKSDYPPDAPHQTSSSDPGNFHSSRFSCQKYMIVRI